MRCISAACCAWRGVKVARAPTPCAKRGPRFAAIRRRALDALIDVIVAKYAPLPAQSLGLLAAYLAAAHRSGTARAALLARTRQRLQRARVDGVDWLWPEGENPVSRRHAVGEGVRLLAPFDPIVWDRRRFELLWGWAYRFEAYTPAPRRVRGYYALPLLWRDRVIGWGNLAWREGALQADIGYVAGQAPRDAGYRLALAEELARLEAFLAPR